MLRQTGFIHRNCHSVPFHTTLGLHGLPANGRLSRRSWLCELSAIHTGSLGEQTAGHAEANRKVGEFGAQCLLTTPSVSLIYSLGIGAKHGTSVTRRFVCRRAKGSVQRGKSTS